MESKREQKLSAIKKTRLFGILAEKALEDLVSRCREVFLEAGELLFSAGEPSKGLYVVVSGRTRAFRHGSDGREQIMHEDGPGATFPEVAVFDDGPYPSSVTAVQDAQLLFLPKSEVRRFCLAHPEMALSALELLSFRLRRATGMVEGFALKDVPQRLGEYLLSEMKRQESDREDLELPHNNQEIADLIGTVREVVSRSFRRLQQNELIEKDRRIVRISHPERLRAFVDGLL
ncbi:MAG: Crp/Fnr family transcriptional regulator [Candidatus Bathyarchaeota archaeon]|nr:Crp/Fnr family transcriptional regulator [Candidatus Bathyarchaeota archaeon]